MVERVTDAKTPADAAGDAPAAPVGNDTVAGGAGNDTGGPDKTIGETGGTDKPVEVKTDWPEKWRDLLAGEDDEARTRLARFKNPENLFRSYRELEKKISSGALKPDVPFPADGTDEDKGAWRKERGLPDTPEGYLENLPDGLVIGEADKPRVETFIKAMHDAHAPASHVHQALNWYYAEQANIAAERAERDKANRAASETALYGKWGPEKTTNIKHMSAALFDGVTDEKGFPILPHAPDGVKEQLWGARLPSGKLLGDDPAVLEWMVNLAQAIDPVGRILPSSGSSLQGLDAEIAAIEKEMRDQTSDYWRNTKKQERLRELYDAKARIGGRAA